MDDRDGRRSERLIALGLVAGLHLGLFWLLTCTPVARRADSQESRMRLVWLPAPAAKVADVPQTADRAPRPRLQARIVEPTQPRIETPSMAPPATVAREKPVDWQQQAREAARQQETSAGPSFAADPLPDRRAQLSGGDRGGRFAMREAVSPADVAGFIGGLFGSYPPPCPRVRQNIAGLLTSTSNRDRQLLQEELRQQRECCAP